VTTGTVFANRKLSFKKIIMAIWEEITAAKGMAALHLSRKLNVQYKTAYVLLQKLREVVGLRRNGRSTASMSAACFGKRTRRQSARTVARRRTRTASACASSR
jgi:hypothetical protein